MSKRIFVHIGYPKTGSTAIQQALSLNRETFAKHGFLYPGIGLDHEIIVLALNGDVDAAMAAEDLRSEFLASDLDVVISSEGLSRFPAVTVRKWFEGVDVRVIVYVREQAQSIASSYQQYIKGELESAPFEEFAPKFLIDYVKVLERWVLWFGAENVMVRLYDREDPVCGDVVQDFLSVLGISDVALYRVDAPDPNPSIAGALLEAKRRLNAAFLGNPGELRALSYQALLDLAQERPDYRGGITMNADVVAHIRERHRESNAALARMFWDREVAFEERPPRRGTWYDEAAVLEAWGLMCERAPDLRTWDAAWRGVPGLQG
jgi:hypothetical protein